LSDEAGAPAALELFAAELIGTALLVLSGRSLVTFAFGDGSPVAHWIGLTPATAA